MTIINPKSIAGVTSITTASGADNLLTVHTNNTTERVRINNDGDVIVGSGITVSPDGDIFTTGVTTATTFVGALTGNVTGNATGLSGTPNISAGTIAGSTGTFTGDVDIADKIVHTGDTDTAIRFSGADTIKLETAGTERFQVDSSGNIYVGGVGGSATAGTLWFNDTSANASKIAQSNGNSALTFHTGSSQPERARIDSSGKLGVGNNNPSFLLDLKATSSADVLRLGNTAESSHGNADVKIVAGGSYYQNFDFQASTYKFQTYNGSSLGERARITSDGKIGIGLDSPNTLLHIQDAAISQGYSSQSSTLLALEDSGDTSLEIASGHNNTSSIFFGDTGSSNKGQINYLHGTGGDAMTFYANGSEQLRITSAGNLGIGANSPSSSYKTTIQEDTSGNGTLLLNRTSNIDGNFRSMVSFERSGTQVGTILCSNSGTQFNTSSDHRLKENVVTMSNATDRLKQLQPKRFNFILNPDITVDGFLAHEVQSVVPEAISGTKDEVDSDNNPVYQGIDQSKLVPLLTAALQEAVTKIEVLETRLNNAGIAT